MAIVENNLLIVTLITILAGFVTWYLNEQSKRIYEEYRHKEERYSELIRSLRGFYNQTRNEELIREFLDQLNLCWMYCPDEVIQKAYNFLNMERTENKDKFFAKEREKAVGKLILAIRRDLIDIKPLKKTRLNSVDFKYLTLK